MPADYRYTLDAITRSREPHVQVASEDTLGIQHALFGYQIPYLPDYLADHTLLGSTRSERVTEVLSRWAQFILGLRKWRASAFALRFLAHPTEGEIEVVLLGRLRGKGQQIPHAALEMATDLAVQLTALGLPHEPLPEVLLQRMLSPFDMVPTILEVRQHEETTSFLTVKDEAYVVHPFWAPAGTWLLPFETMLRQPVPVAVSVFLEPTQLTSPERENLSEAGRIAQTLSDQNIRTYSDTTLRRWRDPQAEMV